MKKEQRVSATLSAGIILLVITSVFLVIGNLQLRQEKEVQSKQFTKCMTVGVERSLEIKELKKDLGIVSNLNDRNHYSVEFNAALIEKLDDWLVRLEQVVINYQAMLNEYGVWSGTDLQYHYGMNFSKYEQIVKEYKTLLNKLNQNEKQNSSSDGLLL